VCQEEKRNFYPAVLKNIRDTSLFSERLEQWSGGAFTFWNAECGFGITGETN
jgi:hypothetical protein